MAIIPAKKQEGARRTTSFT